MAMPRRATRAQLIASLATLASFVEPTLAQQGAQANFPAAVGKLQPRVPHWRANLLAAWHADDRLTATLGVRYSGRQYGTLDNSDPNAFTFTGFSSFVVVDTRVRYRFDRSWSGAVGIDNLNNRKYWAFHPYPQRTYVAELGYDL